jgi:hypothetical protein
MNGKLSEQLLELKYAIDEAIWNSQRIAAAIAVLKHPGRRVEIAIDAALVDDGELLAAPSRNAEQESDTRGLLVLDATDMLFLKTLRISLED